jgi:hypothetical protein
MYDLPENWKDHYEGRGCQCHAGSEWECGGCHADWTPLEVYKLQDKLNQIELICSKDIKICSVGIGGADALARIKEILAQKNDDR